MELCHRIGVNATIVRMARVTDEVKTQSSSFRESVVESFVLLRLDMISMIEMTSDQRALSHCVELMLSIDVLRRGTASKQFHECTTLYLDVGCVEP